MRGDGPSPHLPQILLYVLCCHALLPAHLQHKVPGYRDLFEITSGLRSFSQMKRLDCAGEAAGGGACALDLTYRGHVAYKALDNKFCKYTTNHFECSTEIQILLQTVIII